MLAGQARFTAGDETRAVGPGDTCSSRPASRTGSTTSSRAPAGGRVRPRRGIPRRRADGARPPVSRPGAPGRRARRTPRRGRRSCRPRRGGTGHTRRARRRGTARGGAPRRRARRRRSRSAAGGGRGTARSAGCRAARRARRGPSCTGRRPPRRSAANVSSTCHDGVLGLEDERDRRAARRPSRPASRSSFALDLVPGPGTARRRAARRTPGSGSVSHGTMSAGSPSGRGRRAALGLDHEPEAAGRRRDPGRGSAARLGPRVERVVQLAGRQPRRVVGEQVAVARARPGRSAAPRRRRRSRWSRRGRARRAAWPVAVRRVRGRAAGGGRARLERVQDSRPSARSHRRLVRADRHRGSSRRMPSRCVGDAVRSRSRPAGVSAASAPRASVGQAALDHAVPRPAGR